MDTDLALLHQKIDYLTEQIDAQRKRQQEFDELKQDVLPILNHMVKISISQLAEVDGEFTLEEVLYLLKRLMRDTHLLSAMLDRLEGTMSIFDDLQALSKPVFADAIQSLDEMERKGYFAFARGGQRIFDRIVNEFNEEDLRALGDNIVTILTTVRNMTQPDIMGLANNLVNTLREDELSGESVSTWAMLRELSDPKVRKGLMRLLHAVKNFAEQPETASAKN